MCRCELVYLASFQIPACRLPIVHAVFVLAFQTFLRYHFHIEDSLIYQNSIHPLIA